MLRGEGGITPTDVEQDVLTDDGQDQNTEQQPSSQAENEPKANLWERFRRKLLPKRTLPNVQESRKQRQPQTLEELYEQNGYQEELDQARELAGGDKEKLNRILKEGLFIKNVEGLANRSDQELAVLNPYNETGKDRFEKFKASTKKRALVKAIVAGGIIVVGAGVAAATGGTVIPAVAGLAAKAFGMGSLASFAAGTAVDAAKFWKEDPNKKELASVIEKRHLKIRGFCQRIVKAAQNGYFVENGQAVNLQKAKLDLYEYLTEIQNPNSEENQQINTLKDKILSSEKNWRKRRIIASFLAGFVTSSAEILTSAKELLHSVEVHGFEMHGDGLGGVVDNIKEFDPGFQDQTEHFARRVAEGATDHTTGGVAFEMDSATHDSIHQAVSNHHDTWGDYNDFQSDGTWMHDLGGTGTAKFEAMASTYRDYLESGTVAAIGAAFAVDGAAEGFALDSMQKEQSKIDESKLSALMNQINGAQGASESIEFEGTENRRIGEELSLKTDDVIIGPPDQSLTYTKNNRFLLEEYSEGYYWIRPYDSAMAPIGDAFRQNEEDFKKFFKFAKDTENSRNENRETPEANPIDESDEEDTNIRLEETNKVAERLNAEYQGKTPELSVGKFSEKITLWDKEAGVDRQIKVRKDSCNVFEKEAKYNIEEVTTNNGELEVVLQPIKLDPDKYAFEGWLNQSESGKAELGKFTKEAEKKHKKGEKVFVRFDDGEVWTYEGQEDKGNNNIHYSFKHKTENRSQGKTVGSVYMLGRAIDWYTEKKTDTKGSSSVDDKKDETDKVSSAEKDDSDTEKKQKMLEVADILSNVAEQKKSNSDMIASDENALSPETELQDYVNKELTSLKDPYIIYEKGTVTPSKEFQEALDKISKKTGQKYILVGGKKAPYGLKANVSDLECRIKPGEDTYFVYFAKSYEKAPGLENWNQHYDSKPMLGLLEKKDRSPIIARTSDNQLFYIVDQVPYKEGEHEIVNAIKITDLNSLPTPTDEAEPMQVWRFCDWYEQSNSESSNNVEMTEKEISDLIEKELVSLPEFTVKIHQKGDEIKVSYKDENARIAIEKFDDLAKKLNKSKSRLLFTTDTPANVEIKVKFLPYDQNGQQDDVLTMAVQLSEVISADTVEKKTDANTETLKFVFLDGSEFDLKEAAKFKLFGKPAEIISVNSTSDGKIFIKYSFDGEPVETKPATKDVWKRAFNRFIQTKRLEKAE